MRVRETGDADLRPWQDAGHDGDRGGRYTRFAQ